MRSTLSIRLLLFLCIVSQSPFPLHASYDLIQKFYQQSKFKKSLIIGACLYTFTLVQYGARRAFTSRYTAQEPPIPLAISENNAQQSNGIPPAVTQETHSPVAVADNKANHPKTVHGHGFGDDAQGYQDALVGMKINMIDQKTREKLNAGTSEEIKVFINKIKQDIKRHHIVPDFMDSGSRASALGGPRDREVYCKAIQETLKQNPHSDLFFSGLSRGAGVVAVTEGTHESANHVGTILESAPAHFGDVVENIVEKAVPVIHYIPGLAKAAHAVMHWLPKFWYYKPTGIQPIDVIHKGTKPLLLVASKTDTLIPASQSAQLYLKAQAAGRDVFFKIVHGLQNDFQGGHASVPMLPEVEDAKEAFKKYCLGKATRKQIALLHKLKPTRSELIAQGLVV